MAIFEPLTAEEIRLIQDNKDHILLRVILQFLENEYLARASVLASAPMDLTKEIVGEMRGISKALNALKALSQRKEPEEASKIKRPSAS